MADNNSFLLRVITPDRVFYENQVQMVEFDTTEGEIGVLPGHIPMTVIIRPGILTITEAGGDKEAALHAGFAEIRPDRVTILAEIIEWPDEIDVERAEAAKARAEERLANHTADVDIVRAEFALRKALIRIDAAGLK